MEDLLHTYGRGILPPTDEKKNILIVDDDKTTRMVLKRLLRPYPYVVDEADSGDSCMELMEQCTYQLVLLDLNMHGMDGLTVCSMVKEKYPKVPVVILTGSIERNAIQKSFESGAVDYLQKPVNRNELIARITNVCKMKESEEQVRTLFTTLMDDLKVASEIQKYMLPDRFFVGKSIVTSSLSKPSSELGGDIYDIIELSPHEYIIYMADISGHGVQASLLTSAIKSIMTMIIDSAKGSAISTSQMMNKLSIILSDGLLSRNYLTILLLYVNTENHQIQCFNAGHPPLIHYKDRGKTFSLVDHKGGIPIGWMKGGGYGMEDEDHFTYSDGDFFITYTDGLTEAEQEGTPFGYDGIKRAIEYDRTHWGEAITAPYKILEMIERESFVIDQDDVSILTFEPVGLYNSKFTMEISPHLDDVRKAGERIEQFMVTQGFTEELAMKGELIINELLNNIIIHGLKDKKEAQRVVLFVYKHESTVVITTVDHGVFWKLENGEHSGPYDISGRGIEIIKELSKTITLERISSLNKITIEIQEK